MPGDTLTLTIQTQTLLRIVMGVGAAVLVVAVCWFVYEAVRRLIHLLTWSRNSRLSREAVKKRWKGVEAVLSKDDPVHWRMAIVEADKLFDDVLQSLGMPGKTFAERLKFAQHKYFRLRQLWWAHKLRNQLVHDDNVSLRRSQVRAVVGSYRDALKELGAI